VKRFDSINVIPFIDIMLVLLAIVLTTATFIAEGLLEIQLPESEAAAAARPETSIEVAVGEDGRLFIDGNITDAELLKQSLSARPRTTPVRLRVDAEARFSSFVQVIDMLKLLRMDHLTILTRMAR
jgi:biopolymer transport protein ExbD